MRCTLLWISLGGTALLSGCGWISPRSDFERDPFVMSHLTKGSADSAVAYDDETDGKRSFLSASTSRKHRERTMPANASAASHGAGYRWIRGRLFRPKNSPRDWSIRFANTPSDDPLGGEVVLENTPKLGMLREGDVVMLEGELVTPQPGQTRYRVHELAVLN